MQRKQIRTGFQIKQADQGEVIARIATLNTKDLDADLILPGAFGEQAVQVSAFGHQSWHGELPVGTGRVFERGKEALAELKFFMSTTGGKDTFETIRGLGELSEWSFGFSVRRSAEPDEAQRALGVKRVLRELKVHEVSPVLKGAGIQTQTLSVKCDQCGVDEASTVGRGELERAEMALRGPGTAKARDLASFAAYAGHVLTGLPNRILEPTIKFYARSDRPASNGYVVPGIPVINVAADLAGEQLVKTILHESKHLAQRDPSAWKEGAEAAAEAFADRWSGAVWAAYRQTDGQAHRVRVSSARRRPFPGAHRNGDVILQRHAGRAWALNRRNIGEPWMPIGA